MDKLDLNPRIINAVKRARLTDYGTILSLSAPDIQRRAQLSLSDVQQLHTAVAAAVPRIQHTTALQLLKSCPAPLQRDSLTTGCNVLNKFLHGGVLTRTLTEIAGESASGKTQLCMQLCLTAQLPTSLGGLQAGAVYICTEDVFPNKRLMQMVNLLQRRCPDPEVKDICFTDNIFIEHAAEIEDLQRCLKNKIPLLLSQGRVRLVVVDSIAALFRCDYSLASMQSRAKQLRWFASQLLNLADKHNVAVVCVNQVSDLVNDNPADGFSKRKVIPALGISWANLVTTRLMLRRTNQNVSVSQKDLRNNVIGSSPSPVRTMEVLFAPHLPNMICRYIIDHEGVKGLPS